MRHSLTSIVRPSATEMATCLSLGITLDLYRFCAGYLSVKSSQQETDEMIKHTEEFKQEAVRIALTSGLPRDRAPVHYWDTDIR